MRSIIVDTSVAIKWFSEEGEDDLEKAYRLREEIADRKVLLLCPRIITLEFANVIKFSKKLSQKDCLRSVESLLKLCTNLAEIPRLRLITDIMYTYDLSSYDAAFVALAIAKNIPLITADYKHHRKEISQNIIWLSEWKGKI